MGISIDVRTTNPADIEVTDLYFAANAYITGSSRETNLTLKQQGSPDAQLCTKDQIEDLIKALEMAKKLWL